MNSAHLNEPDADDEYETTETLSSELVAEAEHLLDDVTNTRDWTFETFMRHARLFEEISAEIDSTFDRADNYGTVLEPAQVEHVLETLDATREKLLAAEQDENLAAETFTIAKNEYPAEEGDDTIVTIGLRVNPVRFRGPQAHILPLLLRQLVGKPFDGSHRLLTVPKWLVRRLERHSSLTGIWLAGIVEEVPTGELLEIANALWEPRGTGEYQSPVAVLEAARLLET